MTELQDAPSSMENCKKLSALITVYDYLYGEKEEPVAQYSYASEPTPEPEQMIDRHGDSEFLLAIVGMKSEDAWRLMDELMVAVAAVNPKLYQAVMRRIEENPS